MNTSQRSFLVATLYKFVAIKDPAGLQARLQAACVRHEVKGLLIIATEGINGTIAGAEAQVRMILGALTAEPALTDLAHKESWTSKLDPMERMKVVVREEIVTMGIEGIDPLKSVGTYVEPNDWNHFISDESVCVIDTRNTYEVNIGSFQGAVDPKTTTFREFPDWVRQHRAQLENYSKIAMFCTGGIRCEKATAYLKQSGFDSVYHLKGGILKYLEEVPTADSTWLGQCFVFDKRVSVGHDLEPGDYTRCRGCRHPIKPAEQAPPQFEEGVSCSYCFDQTTDAQKARFRERRKQMVLAAKRGESHLGSNSHFEGKKS